MHSTALPPGCSLLLLLLHLRCSALNPGPLLWLLQCSFAGRLLLPLQLLPHLLRFLQCVRRVRLLAVLQLQLPSSLLLL